MTDRHEVKRRQVKLTKGLLVNPWAFLAVN